MEISNVVVGKSPYFWLSEDSFLLSSRAKSSFLQTTYFQFFFTTSLHDHFYLARAAILFLTSVILSNVQARKASHFSPSSISNFFFLQPCILESCYKYVLFKNHLCIGTAEDQLKPAYENRCNHEYGYATFGNIIICCKLLLTITIPPRENFFLMGQEENSRAYSYPF